MSSNSPKNDKTTLQPLTEKEKMVLEFIELFLRREGYAPTYQEIKNHFGFSSFNSVQRYVKQLQKKQYIDTAGDNQKRAIVVLQSARAVQDSIEKMHEKIHPNAAHHPNKVTGAPSPEPLSLPLLGRVAAGCPIEALDHDEFVEAPNFMVRNPSKTFALLVEGQSMIEDGIFEGDYILVQEQKNAENGEIVVADVDGEATVKHFFWHRQKEQIELRPANSSMQSFWFDPNQVEVKGVVVGLLRKYLP